MLAHAHSRTLCSCKMCINPLGDHVLTCKQHTGSIRGHNHLKDVVASLSRDFKIGPVRVNHKVSTTGDVLASRVLKSLTSLSLYRMVLSLMFPLCVSSRVAVVPLGGGITVCAILMTSYRPVPTSSTTNTRTFMGSCKVFAPAIVGMSGQIHADFLRLLWVLADKQMRSYYESMGKEDKIGNEAF